MYTHVKVTDDTIHYSRLVRQSFLSALDINTSLHQQNATFKIPPQAKAKPKLQPKQKNEETTKQTRSKPKPHQKNKTIMTHFHKLPAELLDRIILFTDKSHQLLLSLAETSPIFKSPVCTALSHKLNIDEKTIPFINRWANIDIPLRTLVITPHIRHFNKQFVFPPLNKLLGSSSLRKVIMPAVAALFTALNVDRIGCLGVYLRNRADVCNLLDVNVMNGVNRLELHCVHDENEECNDENEIGSMGGGGGVDPFCFTTQCATELLAHHFLNANENQYDINNSNSNFSTSTSPSRNVLNCKFPYVSTLKLTCFHKLPCDLLPIIHALPTVHSLILDTPLTYPSPQHTDIRRLRNLKSMQARTTIENAIPIGNSMKSLVAHDKLYTVEDINDLSESCTQLTNLSISIDLNSFYAEHDKLRLPLCLKSLCLYVNHRDIDITICRSHALNHTLNSKKIPIHEIIQNLPGLRKLHVFFGYFDMNDLLDTSELGISLEGQCMPVDEVIINVCERIISEKWVLLKKICVKEVNECTERLYVTGNGYMTDERVHRVWNCINQLKKYIVGIDIYQLERAARLICAGNDDDDGGGGGGGGGDNEW